MPAPDQERQQMSTKPPTAKQLVYLRALAERAGQTFATPRTSKDASAEIRRLKAAPTDSGLEAKIERKEMADAIAEGPQDGARVTPNEITGYGSNCRWSH